MKILSIETASKICAVSLTENKELIKEKILEDGNTHSVKLMPLLDELLKETNTDIQDIDLFACDIGPGSFTGIRIGVATIKAFIDATNKKAVGITSLECLAHNIEDNGIICSIIDAKNENVYYGFFEKKDSKYIKKQEFGFENINNVIEMAGNFNKEITFIGDASTIYEKLIKLKLQNAVVILDKEKNNLNARNLAYIAYKKQDEAMDSNELNPIYLRKSSAEIIKK